MIGMLLPRTAAAVQGAELYRTQAYFYGRFEARVRFAPGEGVVSSFFLWKDGSSSTTTWNELDFEKINSTCHLQTNIWTGQGTQSAELDTPSAFNICTDYHTYAFEWTPDYIAWFIDGSQIRKVTGASVSEYTKNASAGMAMHFNIWQGDSSFGGNLNTSILPVYEYISWAQYSSYSNGSFQLQWREDFTGSTTPTNWALGDWTAPLNHSTHNVNNAKFVNGIAVLALTNDNATGYSGTPPTDSMSGTSGTGGTSGSGGMSGSGGTSGSGTGGTTGAGGTGAGGTGTGGSGRGGAGGTTGNGGSVGTGGNASSGSGGASSTGSGGSGNSGSGGSGAGGVSAGTGGSGAGGVSAGTGGSGTGGVATGTGGSDTGGTTGSGGGVGAGGSSATGSGGATASGGTNGNGGSSGETPGSGGGCSCRTAANGSTGGGAFIALLIVTGALRRRPRNSARP